MLFFKILNSVTQNSQTDDELTIVIQLSLVFSQINLLYCAHVGSLLTRYFLTQHLDGLAFAAVQNDVPIIGSPPRPQRDQERLL